jgi:hypothetical protein
MTSSNSKGSIQPPTNNRLVDDKRNKIISVLMSVHAVRIIGISFLIGVSQGVLSPIFGYTAGLGDILIGVTAIPMAYFFKSGHRFATKVSIVWNILGSIDLVAAIYLGITTSNKTMTTMPWVLIPTVGVPILLTIHVITLWLLRRKK